MQTFDYTVRDASGAIQRGVVEADDPAVARARLRQQGYFITALRPHRDRAASMPRWLSRGVSLDELATVTFQLSALVGAGITLPRGLEILQAETASPRMQRALSSVRKEIEAGRALSQALAKHPEVFSPLYVGMVRSGEVTGILDQALERLATLLDREVVLRQKVRAVLIYPAIVLAMAALVITVFLVYVVPAFEKVYRAGGASLPVPTLVLMALSRVVRRYLVLIVASVAVAAVVTAQRGIWSRFRPWVDSLILRLPALGRVAKVVLVSRFARTLGTMLRSGVPILRALEATADAVDQREMRRAIGAMQAEIDRGRRLREAMGRIPLFPPMVLQMVALGEESGTLDVLLERAADLLDRQAEYAAKRLLTIMEPVLTLALGAVVGLILIALYLPMFGLARAVLR